MDSAPYTDSQAAFPLLQGTLTVADVDAVVSSYIFGLLFDVEETRCCRLDDEPPVGK